MDWLEAYRICAVVRQPRAAYFISWLKKFQFFTEIILSGLRSEAENSSRGILHVPNSVLDESALTFQSGQLTTRIRENRVHVMYRLWQYYSRSFFFFYKNSREGKSRPRYSFAYQNSATVQ